MYLLIITTKHATELASISYIDVLIICDNFNKMKYHYISHMVQRYNSQ